MERKKALIVSTVSRQFYLFEQGNIEVLQGLGYEIHCAANFADANPRLDDLAIHRHHIDIERSPLSVRNFTAYKQLKHLMSTMQFDIVHCHSPVGGVIGRLAALSARNSNVIYTAHGFHFYKGAPWINWIFFYNIEKFLSKYTKTLITINKEDYEIAKRFYAEKTVHVPGIGVDTNRYKRFGHVKNNLRHQLGISSDSCILISIGELIERKNHKAVIKAISMLNDLDIIYLIVGKGVLDTQLKELVGDLKLSTKVSLLGYRNDIPDLCSISDIFVFPSFQEGLPVSVMEAMASGLPIIASNIRGNVDLITNGSGGFLFDVSDVKELANKIRALVENKALREKMGRINEIEANNFDKSVVMTIMKEIYQRHEALNNPGEKK